MPIDPVQEYGAVVLYNGGFRVSGGAQGFKATVPYLVEWAFAYLFQDAVLGFYSATSIGLVNYTGPYIFPGSANARLYAVSCEIEPCGASGNTSPGFTQGLTPGEFFSHAKCTVQFETPSWATTDQDDPQRLNQLDPANPITYCEQSISSTVQATPIPAAGYVWANDPDIPVETLSGSIYKKQVQTILTLSFPKLPFLPWSRVQNILGKTNANTIFTCGPGTLLALDAKTKFAATTQGLMGQLYELNFSYEPIGWDYIYRKDTAQYELIVNKNDDEQYLYDRADLSQLFNFTPS